MTKEELFEYLKENLTLQEHWNYGISKGVKLVLISLDGKDCVLGTYVIEYSNDD